LLKLGLIRGTLTSPDLSLDTKFGPCQLRDMLPVSKNQVSWAQKIIEAKRSEKALSESGLSSIYLRFSQAGNLKTNITKHY